MAERGLPTGTVTFLFTDLEGSTRLWEGPRRDAAALARHDEILRDTASSTRGHVVKTTGDGFHAAFAGRRRAWPPRRVPSGHCSARRWRDTDPLRVRMGLHTGAGEIRDGDYYGTASTGPRA